MNPPFKPTRLNRAVYYGIIGALGGFAYALVVYGLDTYYEYSLIFPHILVAPVVAAIVAYAFGREEDRIRQQAILLDRARERFTSLTHSAISEDDWEISLHDPHIPTCWEVKSCEAHSCPAFGKRHVRCWMVAGTYCRGEVQGRYAQKLKYCTECEVFQEALGNDPLNEISENFNSLMWILREKEEDLKKSNSELQTKYDELEALHQETKEIANTDELTGLRNRGHFLFYLSSEFSKAKRYGKPLSLILVELERFRAINNDYGYQKGDKVLQRLGTMLKNEVSGRDYLARYGKEAFALVMSDMDGVKATAFAEKLQRKMKRVAEDMEIPARYTVADFGIADFPDCAADSDSMISAADSALLFAKRKGQSRVAYFCDLSETELNESDLDRLNSRLEGATMQTLDALAAAVNVSDHYTGEDTDSLSLLAITMARDLGMKEEQADALALATRLHDIGKIGVPGSILRKDGKLTEDELSLVKQHPEIGQRLLQEAEQIKDLISAILYHHERWDGTGYPEKLKGDQIPLMARIVGIFDAYRAMRCDRPYRKALSKKQATNELRKCAGSQFDPKLVELFLDLVEKDSCQLEQKAG